MIMELKLETWFVDNEKSRLSLARKICDGCSYDDVAVIYNMDDPDIAYIKNAIIRGWTGKYLKILLTRRDTIHIDILYALENGILMVKDREALVWNSQFIFIFSDDAKVPFRWACKHPIRDLSPRETKIEI